MHCKLHTRPEQKEQSHRSVLVWSRLRRCCSAEEVITGCPDGHSAGGGGLEVEVALEHEVAILLELPSTQDPRQRGPLH